MAEKPWGAVFADHTDPRVEKFTESVSFDRRLYGQDVVGSVAHARMLAAVGLISREECCQIEQTLRDIRQEIEQGQFPFHIELEDIHMHIERALTDRLGDVGRKLHTARSRNDQVATDLRLWVREAIDRDRRSAGGAPASLARPRRARCRLRLAGLYPHATGAARAGGPLLAGLCRKVRSATAAGWRVVGCGRTCSAWARRRWPAPACRSIGNSWRASSSSMPLRPTASMSRAIAILSSNLSSV